MSDSQHDRTAKENHRRVLSIRVLGSLHRLPHGAHGDILKAITSSPLPHGGIWLHQASWHNIQPCHRLSAFDLPPLWHEFATLFHWIAWICCFPRPLCVQPPWQYHPRHATNMSLPSSEVQYQLAHIHEDRASDIVISHAVVLPLAVIAVVARFIARRLCKAHIGLDDYMIVVALVRLILSQNSFSTRGYWARDSLLTKRCAQSYPP